jgi:hypothetical protein
MQLSCTPPGFILVGLGTLAPQSASACSGPWKGEGFQQQSKGVAFTPSAKGIASDAMYRVTSSNHNNEKILRPRLCICHASCGTAPKHSLIEGKRLAKHTIWLGLDIGCLTCL